VPSWVQRVSVEKHLIVPVRKGQEWIWFFFDWEINLLRKSFLSFPTLRCSLHWKAQSNYEVTSYNFLSEYESHALDATRGGLQRTPPRIARKRGFDLHLKIFEALTSEKTFLNLTRGHPYYMSNVE
jgi:hypothetical protein